MDGRKGVIISVVGDLLQLDWDVDECCGGHDGVGISIL